MAGDAATPVDNSNDGSPDAAGDAFEKLGLVDFVDEIDEQDDAPKPKGPSKDTPAGEDDDDTEGLIDDDAEPAEDDEQEGESDEDEPAPKAPVVKDEDPVFTLEIEGKETAITKAEAKAGYLRTQDYTRKTMAVAEERKALEAEKGKYKAVLEQYDTYLGQIVAKEPDWEKLRVEDPQEYLLKKDEWTEAQREKKVVADEKARLAKEAADADEAKFKAFLEDELRKLNEKLPAWKDPKNAQREVKAVRKGLKDEYQFTDEEIATGLIDHRLIIMCRDALLYRANKARAKTKLAPVAPSRTLRPGPTPTPTSTATKGLRDARTRLASSGSAEDAAAVFQRIPGLV